MGLIVLFVLLAAAGVAVAWYLKEQRRKAWAQAAATMGFQFSAADPFGLVDLPFALFGRGDGRGVENVVWGESAGVPVKAFDYWYYDVHTDAEGRTSRQYHRYTAAVAEVPLAAPATAITPETLFTRLADALGMRDIEFESEEFNRAWQVKSADRRFASYLVDARMMEWLLAARDWAFEIGGGTVLCYADRLAPPAVASLLAALIGFSERIPRVALDTYGAPA